jgi:TatD DNase family protein
MAAFGASHPTSANPVTGGYVDVHAHLIHEQFHGEEDVIAEKCKNFGLEYIIVNGLEPVSNRATLELARKHSHILPAAGIYPLDAACNFIVEGDNWKHPFPPPTRFDVDAEIAFIDSLASEKKIVALGECGLDKHYLTDEVSFAEQERVLRQLMRVGISEDWVEIMTSDL